MKKVITVTDYNSIVTVHRPKDLTAYELEIIITVLKKDLEDKRSEYETKERRQEHKL
jgi:hypothetical protein